MDQQQYNVNTNSDRNSNQNILNNYKQTQNIKKLQKQQTELQNFLKSQQNTNQNSNENSEYNQNQNSFKSPQNLNSQKNKQNFQNYTPQIHTESSSQNSEYKEISKQENTNSYANSQNILELKPLVQKNQYSLEPDMRNGWKPKNQKIQKQSGPIPLQLDNNIVDLIIYKLETEKNMNAQHQTSDNSSSQPVQTICYIGYRPKSSLDFYDTLQDNIHKNTNQYDFSQVYKEWLENSNKKKSVSYVDKLFKDYYENNPEKLRNYGDGKYKSSSETMVNYITKQRIQDRKVDFVGKNEKIYKNCHYITKKYSSQFLIFDSLFESGNLDLAVRVGEREYDLFMRVDTNSRGHTHWFYFQVEGMQKGFTYKFNICNFTKTRTLYERGMKPFVFSKIQSIKNNKKWSQQGQNITYTQSTLKNFPFLFTDYEINNHYYTMKFEFVPQDNEDTISFCYSVPYSYSQLYNYFDSIKKLESILEISILFKSLSNLDIPLLTITDFNTPDTDKKIIVMQARIHPGEANSSYVMQGIIDNLLSQDQAMQNIRKKVIFKIVPMLNVDGVVFGNYRCSSSGKDLNRMFIYNDKYKEILYPEIKGIKTMLYEVKENKKSSQDIIMFLDLHGHSQRKNVFIYGPNYPIYDLNYYKCRLFPKIISQNSEMFRYFSCLFRISPGKEKTARAEILRAFQIVNTFTIESSNGQYYSDQQVYDFTAKLWKNMGNIIALSIDQYLTQMFEFMRILEERQQKLLQQQQNNNSLHNTITQPQNNNILPYTFVRQSSKNHIDSQNSNRKSQTKYQTLIGFDKQNDEDNNNSTFDKISNKDSRQNNHNSDRDDSIILKNKKNIKIKIKNKSLQKNINYTPNKKNTKKIYSSPDKKNKPLYSIQDLLQQTPFEDFIDYFNQEIPLQSDKNQQKKDGKSINFKHQKTYQDQDSDQFSRNGSDSEESDEDLNLKDQENLQQQIIKQCKGSSKNSALTTPTKVKSDLINNSINKTPTQQIQNQKLASIDKLKLSNGSKNKNYKKNYSLFSNKIIKKQSKSFYNPDSSASKTQNQNNLTYNNEINSITQQNFQKSFSEQKSDSIEQDIQQQNLLQQQNNTLISSIKFINYANQSPNNKNQNKNSQQNKNSNHKRLLPQKSQIDNQNQAQSCNNLDQNGNNTKNSNKKQNGNYGQNNIIQSAIINQNNNSNNQSQIMNYKNSNILSNNINNSSLNPQQKQVQQFINFNSASVIIQQYPMLNISNNNLQNNSLKQIIEKNFEKQKQEKLEKLEKKENNNDIKNINKQFEMNYAALQKQQEQIKTQYQWSPVKQNPTNNIPKRQNRCITVTTLANNTLSRNNTIPQQQQEQYLRQRYRILSLQQKQMNTQSPTKYPKVQQNYVKNNNNLNNNNYSSFQQKPQNIKLTQQQLKQAYQQNNKNSIIQFISQNDLDDNCFSDQSYKQNQFKQSQKLKKKNLYNNNNYESIINKNTNQQNEQQFKNNYIPKSANNLEFESLKL